MILAPLLAVLLALAAPAALAVPSAEAPAWAPGAGVKLERVTDRVDSPVDLTSIPGDPRLFVVEQRGVIKVIANGRVLDTPFLDLTDRVSSGGERGLLGLAFHPDYAKNGWLFVDYTDKHGDTRVERYSVTRDSNRADPKSGQLVIEIDQPYSNHNGGDVEFGPDGMLYIGMGDGGSGGDPHGNGQNKDALLAKLLRLDVSHGLPYTIPQGNPFAHGGGRPEIWALGLRNPWRFWIDPPAGLLYIADVGQNAWEELDVAPLSTPGLDYGWNRYEGTHAFRGDRDTKGLMMPVLEYSHRDGCSITGGVVYRGTRVPALQGCYVFSDYCRAWIRSVRIVNGRATEWREWRFPELESVTSFGVGGDGELYVLGQGGDVWRFTAAP